MQWSKEEGKWLIVWHNTIATESLYKYNSDVSCMQCEWLIIHLHRQWIFFICSLDFKNKNKKLTNPKTFAGECVLINVRQ